MTDIKVVVGANFGDEGKGLMTDYFCHQATSKNKSCIVVMSNGGAQRGHTVNLLDGKRHVFKHFGWLDTQVKDGVDKEYKKLARRFALYASS